MRACGNTASAKITGLVTGHPQEKGTKYGALYGVPASSVYTYDTFDRIRDNPEIEAVYIGLPNSMHCEFTVRAAEAGKHVLCEKPMAISSKECQTMIDACRKAGVKLMIAYRLQYDPTIAQARQLIHSGAMGNLVSLGGGYFNEEHAGRWRLTRALGGGGSLMDLGIYPLNTMRFLLGEEPVAFTAAVSTMDHSGKFSEVEQSVEWTMKFPSGVLAGCGCSYGARGANYLHANAENGHLELQPAYSYDGLLMNLATGYNTGVQSSVVQATGKHPFQFTLEAEHFAACIRNNTEPRTPGEEGLKDLLAIEAIYQAAGTPIA
jgi:predicted dehydrogenase